MPMTPKMHPIRQMVQDGITVGCAISAEQIQQLRDQSEKGITLFKWVFWVAIGLFNLMVWYPLPTPIAESLRWTVGVGSLLIAVVFPVIVIRRHRGNLAQLEECTQAPKRRKTDVAGRKYMDQVKKQGRYFVQAEYSVLEGETAL